MKQAVSVLWQTVVLFAAALAGFVVGMTRPALRVSHELSRTATSVRTYDYDWLIAVLLAFVVLLVMGALRRRVRETAVSAGIALVITIAVIVLFTQIGVKDTPLYAGL